MTTTKHDWDLDKTKIYGQHILAEYFECDASLLQDISYIKDVLIEGALASHANIVNHFFHPFHPQGVSGVLVLKESHFSIHTWPEWGYASVDIYTCGNCDPLPACLVVHDKIKSSEYELLKINRGNLDNRDFMKTEYHYKKSRDNTLYKIKNENL